MTATTAAPARRGEALDKLVYWGLMGQMVVLPLAHTATILTIVTITAMAAFLLKAVRGRVEFHATSLDLPLLLFLAAALVSTVASVDRFETLNKIRSDVIIPLANFYLAAWGLSRREELVGLSRAAVVSLGLLSFYGVAHFFFAGGRLDSYNYREKSLSEDFHYLGTYLVVVLPVVLAAFKTEVSRRWRWAALAVAAVTPLAVYVSFDRGCWLALLVIGLGLYPTFLKRFKVYLAGLIGVALVVALFLPSAVLIHGRWIGVHEGKDIEANTLSQRLVVWDYCWRCFKESPLTGIGLGRNNFWPAYAEFVTFYEKFQLFHCHNAYFDMALQTGLPGLLAFLALFATGLVVCWRIWTRAGPTARLWGAAGFLSLAGFVVRLLWDSLYQDEHARVLWLVLGLVWAARRIEEREAGRSV